MLEIILDVDPACHLIPAHIWTPWFSLLGSKSGFDTVEECFGDLTPHIFALETGLSSDPPMNWRVSSLDRYTLVSNSDAHSPEKLAREATLFDDRAGVRGAVRRAAQPATAASSAARTRVLPRRGQVPPRRPPQVRHLSGSRRRRWRTAAICPVCGKEVTVGVMHRVEELADRPVGYRPPRPQPYTT